ncbi:neuronal acetylcholine receptor subunit alpha-7-like isoform X2 [Anopheles nili]|uniref:neuronal acetylcholine receptor subunit alpha-7-like isoform X2 n=1 Tax=Anopheles nili TaxID=185578 RepID=UPI00237B4F74|nr:neuronal acetylcholine receptor subunit alpha-7-like isoform X2 [Anopheles nili]
MVKKVNKKEWICAWCFVILSITVGQSVGESEGAAPWTPTWADTLKKDLLKGYDPSIRPSQHYNVTTVEARITITHVEINEIKSTLSVYGWMKFSWNDPKLTWNPANYGNLNVVRWDPTVVWRPDVVLYNNADGSDQHHYGDTNVLVYNQGKVLWVPPTEYHAFCELNMRLWPFDYQKCIVKIGSWTFDGYMLNLTLGSEPEIETLVSNSEWKIVKISAERNVRYYPCCTEPYTDVTYNVTLQRQSDTHRAIVIVPALVIIILALSVFWLPLESGERIITNGIVAIMITIYLVYFAQQLPAISGHTPLIVIFFSNTLLLTAFSTVICVIVLNVSKCKHQRPLPAILKRAAACVGPFVGVGKKHFSLSEKGNDTIEYNHVHEWFKFGLALNRASFIVYCVIFIICAFYSF